MMKRLIAASLLFGLIWPGLAPVANAAEFASSFASTPNRVWAGANYWANPLEDWRVHDGKLECVTNGPNRSVHLLTHQLAKKSAPFTARVQLGQLDKQAGSAGIRLGIHGEIDDYRASLIHGSGVDAGITSTGSIFLGNKTFTGKLPDKLPAKLELVIEAQPGKAQPGKGGKQTLTLSVKDVDSGKTLATVSNEVPNDYLHGNIALVNNPRPVRVGQAKQPKTKKGKKKGNVPGGRFWFQRWQVAGPRVEAHDNQKFGPVLWTMHTLSKNILKMTAQMPPIGAGDSPTAQLAVKRGAGWMTIAEAKITPRAYTATFRVTDWDSTVDTPFRVIYVLRTRNGDQPTHYEGTIRKDPVHKATTSLAALSCQGDMAFPNADIANNVLKINPDVVFFAGDQIYESSGGFPLVRAPVDRACLNYLHKWYLFGMSFGEVMRDRPAVVIPDDHDVYQGNIWGNGGNAVAFKDHPAGGYAQHRDFVEVVHLTQTSHLSDPYDPTPIKQNISVYYTDMVYGRVGFAIVADRMFKSGPQGTVATWKGRPDHIRDPKFDVRKLDKPGLVLLGERQEKFLKHWATDWKGVDMKCVLSQTNLCNVANYHGGGRDYLVADLDSGGWPQTPRDRAVDLMRRGFALHVCGDQHLTTLVHNGIDKPGDGNVCFTVPAIANVYPRRWIPDEEGKPAKNRPAGGLPNTGDYRDGLDNAIRVLAVGNPEEKYRKGRLEQQHDKACGFGVVRFHHNNQTITMESWRMLVDVNNPQKGDQFPGWPYTIKMLDNYGREPTGHLPTLKVTGMTDPVVQVFDEKNKEIVYTLRIKGDSFRPMVFTPGPFTVRVGELGTPQSRELRGVTPTADAKQTLKVSIK